MPEKFNSIIWLRDNKDTLAMGNITGAMVFQSTIPISLGILFTRWELGFLDIFSVALALISGAYIYFTLKNLRPIKASYLMGCEVLYAVFVVGTIFTVLAARSAGGRRAKSLLRAIQEPGEEPARPQPV